MSGDRILLLVRLKAQQPDGTVVGDTRRTCHVVSAPDAKAMPEFLTAYCGLRIAPGAGDVLPSPVGTPCLPCAAHSPVPAFGMLGQFRDQLGIGNAEF